MIVSLMHPTRGGENSEGFTLIEALLGILLGALVLGILGTSFRFSIREWEREQARNDGGMRAVMRLLARQLASYDPVAQGGENARVLSMRGTSSEISFPTLISLSAWHGGAPVLVRYVFFTSPDGGELVYSEKAVDETDLDSVVSFLEWQPSEGIPSKDLHVLITPAKSFSLSYDRTRDRGRSDTWEHIAELPQAVICRFQDSSESKENEVALYPKAFDFDGARQ